MSPQDSSKKISRRRFLQRAALAGGATTVPLVLSATTHWPTVYASRIAAQSAPVSNGYRGQNFSGDWKFRLGDLSGAQAPGFDDTGWRSLQVPHDWSIELPFNQSSPGYSGGGYLDGGIGWYRKHFSVPASASGQRVCIQFDGVYMNSQVWINGTLLGTRPYGYSSFEYELTPYLTYGGTNTLAVRVNNNQPTSRWYSGSGIYRNVWLTTTNPLHVAYCGLFVSTPSVSASAATVRVSTRVQNQANAAQTAALRTSILDAGGATVAAQTSAATSVAANGETTITQNLTVNSPQLWSTSVPYLYTLRTEVLAGTTVVDTYQTTLGIRTFAMDANTGCALNGVPIKLNGVCMHHDLGALGAAVNYRAIERQIQIMKAMGCNAIRTSHNPPDPMLLDVCDRLGLLVIDEAFDAWQEPKMANDYHLYFDQWAQTDIKAMVRRDRNHPSVVMYSVGNEIHDQITSGGAAIAQNLINWVKQEDATRLVTLASNYNYNATGQAVANLFDAVGYNYAASLYDSQHAQYPSWKMFGSETSSAVRSRGIYKLPTTQNILTGADTQCSSYDNSVVDWGSSAERSYKDTNSRAFIAGEFIWTGFDYIGEPTPYAWPAKSSYFGIVDTCGFPKDIYYFYQSRWTSSPMVHLLPHWNWQSGQTMPVWAYTNCDSVELFLNGSSLGSRSFTAGGALHLEWMVPFQPGTLRAEARRNGTIVAATEVRTAGAAARVQLSTDRSSITADGTDLAFITADIVDAAGTLVPNASTSVSFSVSGPGRLIGVDNGNAISHESYKGTSRLAFSGKCLAIVQSSGASGTVVVSASASGLGGGSVTINAQPATATATPTPVTPTALTPTATPTASVSNLAQGKPASADSAEAANPAARGNDGNPGTRWCASDGNPGHWWQVDLGSVASLTGSEVVWEFGDRAYRYRVELSSNGSGWITVADRTTNTTAAQIQRDTFSASGRYVRITVTGLSTSPVAWASFYEFRVFGTTASSPTPTALPTATATATPTAPPTATATSTPTAGSGIDPNAYYRIVARHSGKVLDVRGVSTANGAAVQQWTNANTANQQWRLVPTGDGYYTIVARHSGKVLDVRGVSTADGAAVQQWTNANTANQQWRLVPVSGGYYTIVARHSGKVLDVTAASTANGADVQQWSDTGSTNQHWQVVWSEA